MSSLDVGVLRLPGHRVQAASWFPAIRELIHSEISADLDEDDGLFIGYGMFGDGLPYTLQDDYDTPLEELSFKTAVLENRYLRAEFVPELGGRLWSLYDKEHGRELLLANTQLLPCNLAIRNAWFAGGVEFNCGRRGHDAQTMSPRFMATLETAEYPVLRFYEYQRDRGTPFQYDCFLPDESRFLYIRTRIWNPNRYLVPMYWWSNIATAEEPGSRIVVPAMDAFANWYSGGSHALAKLRLPDGEGFDGTYPENFRYVKDHFYNIPEGSRKYECQFFRDGYGFCHVSTPRLRGRKLFVWGSSQGGRHWNRKLLGPGLDTYIELQAGLGRTQQECIPMPPRTAWEWLEGYGALTMSPDQVFGEWSQAVEATTAAVDELIPQVQLDAMLKTTRESIALKPGVLRCTGSGWGALEELRTGEKLAEHLDFGTIGPEQEAWAELLNTKAMTTAFPISYQVSDEWFQLLKAAAPSWQTHYHLALNWLRREDVERAEQELTQAGDPTGNRHLLHAWANLRKRQGRTEEAAEMIQEAALADVHDASFLKECLKMLLGLKAYGRMEKVLACVAPDVAERPLLKLMKAFVLVHTGRLEEAEDLLTGHGPWDIPDIREGENSTSQLYLALQAEKARRRGEADERTDIPVPFHLDLRMSE